MGVTTVLRAVVRKRPVALPAALLTAAALAMTACSSSSGPSPAAPTSPAPPSASSSGSSPGSASGSPTSPSAPSTAPRTGTSPTSPQACATGPLSVALTNPDVAAGQYYATLVFTNTSATSCTLTGYPGVSYVVENGVQSGNAAVRENGTVTSVILGPGGKASAKLHDSNGIGGYDPAQCQLSPAEGLRIYPPNQTAALFLPWKTEHCAGPTIHSLTIGPVQQGQ